MFGWWHFSIIVDMSCHMGGKKHLARLAELEVIGQTVIFIA